MNPKPPSTGQPPRPPSPPTPGGASDRSPDKPWKTGSHPTYTAYRITVAICDDQHGRVWSEHGFTSQADADACGRTQNGGVEQVAHALLSEALRREAFVDLLVALTQNPKLLDQWNAGSEEDRENLVQQAVEVVTQVVTNKLPKALPGLVRGVFEMMAHQGESQQSPTE